MSKDINSVEWIDKGDHWLLKIGGEFQKCVSCGKPLEHAKESRKPNHKCPESHESRARGSGHRHQELGETRTPCEGELIADGFKMMRDDDP